MRYSGPIADVHNHTDCSPLDGLQTPAEAVARGVELEHPAMAITDHGTNTGQPQFQYEAIKAGIQPLLGIEAYFQPDRKERPAAGDKAAMSRLWGGDHLVLLAMDNAGLKDMWAASSEAYATGHYHRPRMDWDLLERYGSRLIATTACLGGVVTEDLKNGNFDQAFSRLERLHSIFGDRLYLEIQANELPDQIRVNQMLAQMGRQYGIPLVLANDAHYSSPEQAELHRLWMACQSGKNKEDYWHFSPILGIERIRELTSYLDPADVDQALANTMVIAGRCSAKIDAHFEPPVFGASAEDDSRQLLAMCRSNWDRIRDPSREHLDRLEREFEIVASKGMSGCYLMTEEIVSWERGQGGLVGPGRGSDAGSLMSYLIGITSMDPLPARLLFERFLTPGRASLPDFDLDFASSRRPAIQDHVVQRYGADHVVRVGTIMRYGIRGILNKLFSVMEDRLPEEAIAEGNQISRIIEDAEANTAGLGLPVDEMMEEPALQPYIEKYASVFDRALDLVNRVYAYGKHPAGLIISPQVALTGILPTRSLAGELAVAEVDYRVADEMGLFKLDALTVSTLDKVHECIKLVERNYGVRLDPRAWRIEHSDPQVWEEIGTGLTLGMFQIETSLCRDYCARMKPRSLDDLADLTTFIRPGPRNSGATESYLRRRAGAEEVTYPHPLLEEALRWSYGVVLYQEDILLICRILAGYDDLEADGVRKILGKKLTEKIAAAGEEFVRRCVERGHDEEQVRDLWAKMAEFGKYAFNRCETGDTRIYLAASSQYSDGTIDVATLHRRLHAQLLPPEPSGWAAVGRPKYQGPCVICGADGPGKRTRGACNSCYVWRQKFNDPKRGLHGLSYYADGRIRPARIVDVVAQGEREVWKITLKDGKSITATGNHRHLTDAGYRRVDELIPGDSLITDGGYEEDHYDPGRHRLTRGERRRQGNVRVSGEANYNFIDGGAAFWADWKKTHPRACAQCGTAEGRIETAHLDGDHANNTEGNLAWLCASCHKAYDYAHNDRRRRWQKGHLAEAVPIESVEYAGVQETYDVVMDAPHNFVANGIVTHNSHGFSYATMSYWTAWLKVHYPVEMITATLGSLIGHQHAVARMAEFTMEARRMGITVLPPSVVSGSADFTMDGLTVRYGLRAIKGMGPAKVGQIIYGQPYSSVEDFKARSGADAGALYDLARAGALDELAPSRKGLIQVIEADRSGDSVRCIHKAAELQPPYKLPCYYDWDGEPKPPPRYGKPDKKGNRHELKMIVKPPPKICSRACRRYTPPEQLGMGRVAEYDPAALFRMDWEIYKTWMSEAPFALLDEFSRGLREQARQIGLMLPGAPHGYHTVAAIYAARNPRISKKGSKYWWVTLVTEVSKFDVTCFSPRDDRDRDVPMLLDGLRPGQLVGATVQKGQYMAGASLRTSWNLADIWPMGE